MPRPIFQAFLALPSQKTTEQPSWATHVVEHKHDTHEGEKKLFWALYDESADNGKGEYKLGPDTFGCFHPDAYTVFDTVPFKRVANNKAESEPAKTGPKYYNMPAYKVGDKWWVGLPGQKHLVKASITKVGVLILGLNYHQDGYSVNRTFKFADIEMVEPEEWSE